jgi:endogenous inhibitor of DNA gyrase (YacG/DUF329 family)
VCEAAAAPRSENRAFPFCSERCQTIDLGRWLDERYRIPAEDAPTDGSGGSGGSDDSDE